MEILDDGDGTLAAYGTAYVQLAVLTQGNVHLGVGDVAPDVAQIVGHGQHGAQGAAALDLEGQAGAHALQGVAHEAGGGQGAAQGRGAHRQQLVYLPCPLRQVTAADSGGLYQAVG